MSKILLNIGGQNLTLVTQDFGGDIDVDDLLQMHYENIPGEVATMPTLVNRVGSLKASAESAAKFAKLALEIYEADFKKRLRREASVNGNFFKLEGERIKLSEKSLSEAVTLDKQWKILSDAFLNAEADHSQIESLYWAVCSKDKKLDNLVKGIVPEDMMKDLVEGKINDMTIRKGGKSITKRTGS